MIYNDEFVEYLKSNLGDPVKVTSTNIICRCPWCEYDKTDKKHYHLYISLKSPIFHCFYASCNHSGLIKKLLEKIEGKDTTEKFVSKENLEKFKSEKFFTKRLRNENPTVIPPLNEHIFPYKEQYLRKRFKFANTDIKNMKGLVFDIKSFVKINNVQLSDVHQRILDYLHTNFVGFVAEHGTVMSLRNVDDKSEFHYYKWKLSEMKFLDYYRLPGGNPHSNTIILGEGIFDIATEHIFDSIGMKSDARVYACGFSGGSYLALIKSLIFHEQIFRPDVIILSDKDVEQNNYKKLKKFNGHIIDTLNVYYNRTGKDFNITPIVPERFII